MQYDNFFSLAITFVAFFIYTSYSVIDSLEELRFFIEKKKDPSMVPYLVTISAKSPYQFP